MDKLRLFENGSGKIIVIAIIAVLVFAGAGVWFFSNQKSPEGGACFGDAKCESGLKCVSSVCSSRKTGSPCDSKDGCQSGFCVGGKCTTGAVWSACVSKNDCAVDHCVNGVCADGKKGSACSSKDDCAVKFCVAGKCADGKSGDLCATYKDCDSGLLCQKSVCAAPPDYSKFFSKVVVSRMKAGLPPGPDNIPVVATEFKNTDGIEIDFVGVKPTLKSEFYYEFVDGVTGEVALSMAGFKQRFAGRDVGTGTDLRALSPGVYDLNIYIDGKTAYTTQIKIVDR